MQQLYKPELKSASQSDARVRAEGGHPARSLSQCPACPEQPWLINPLTGATDTKERRPTLKGHGSISPLTGHQIKTDMQAPTYPAIKGSAMHCHAHQHASATHRPVPTKTHINTNWFIKVAMASFCRQSIISFKGFLEIDRNRYVWMTFTSVHSHTI